MSLAPSYSHHLWRTQNLVSAPSPTLPYIRGLVCQKHTGSLEAIFNKISLDDLVVPEMPVALVFPASPSSLCGWKKTLIKDPKYL
jgi:hypothetical protein